VQYIRGEGDRALAEWNRMHIVDMVGGGGRERLPGDFMSVRHDHDRLYAFFGKVSAEN
jgi:hypothetical protein